MVVVVGVLFRGDSFFLARRAVRGRDYEGCWEFPGGKLEDGESPEFALRREWREELGVDPIVGEEIGSFNFKFHKKEFLLKAYRVFTDVNLVLNPEIHDESCWVQEKSPTPLALTPGSAAIWKVLLERKAEGPLPEVFVRYSNIVRFWEDSVGRDRESLISDFLMTYCDVPLSTFWKRLEDSDYDVKMRVLEFAKPEQEALVLCRKIIMRALRELLPSLKDSAELLRIYYRTVASPQGAEAEELRRIIVFPNEDPVRISFRELLLAYFEPDDYLVQIASSAVESACAKSPKLRLERKIFLE